MQGSYANPWEKSAKALVVYKVCAVQLGLCRSPLLLCTVVTSEAGQQEPAAS